MTGPPIPPPPGAWAPPAPVRAPVGGQRRLISVGAVVLVVVSLVLIVPAWLLPQLTGASPLLALIPMLAVPAVIAVGVVLLLRRMRRTARVLELDATGFTHRRVSDGAAARVEWREFSAVLMTTAYHVRRYGGRTYRLRLILTPATPAFEQRRPELSEYVGRYGARSGDLGIPLALYRQVGPIDALLRGSAVSAYRGVVEEGWVIGFGYD